MNIYALKGHKVRFTGQGGYPLENEFANKHLVVGDIYEVDHTDVGQSSTSVYLIGLERTGLNGEKYPQSWNSVMFEDVEPQSPEDDKKHSDYKMWHR